MNERLSVQGLRVLGEGVLTNRWGRIALALLAGAGAALAHPPFGVLPGLLGYPLLMLLAERSRKVKGGFWVGWLAGFSYFFIGCWWVAEAFLVNKDQAWMAPFAASLLPMGLGLFFGTATALYRRFAPQGVRRVLLFAALFALLEWLRGHVLTGFPWNPTCSPRVWASRFWPACSPLEPCACRRPSESTARPWCVWSKPTFRKNPSGRLRPIRPSSIAMWP